MKMLSRAPAALLVASRGGLDGCDQDADDGNGNIPAGCRCHAASTPNAGATALRRIQVYNQQQWIDVSPAPQRVEIVR